MSLQTEDEEVDAVGTFERAYIGEGRVTSPKRTDSEKAGILDRLSGRAYRDKKKKKSELYKKNSTLEKEIIELRTQLYHEKEVSDLFLFIFYLISYW